jgi:aspartyl protease family protein
MSESRKIGVGMTIAAWAGLLLVLTWAASIFLQKQENPNPSPQSTHGADGKLQVLLQQNRAGHYVANGMINQRQVRFLLDTGATFVAIDKRLARKLGLELGPQRQLQTANGTVYGNATILDEVSLGGITIHRVQAVVMPSLGDEVLLGMSFLKRLTLIQKGKTLLLQAE